MNQTPTIIPVILCGGSGTRLWPMSREQMPKQFLRLIGDETLLQATALRAMLVGKVPADHIVTVTLDTMKEAVESQYNAINPALSSHILCEPMARNTSAAIAFAASYVAQKFGEDALLWILAADHYMGDINNLGDALQHAVNGAQQDYLVTFGIQPNRPETGYGYIKSADAIDGDLLSVQQFIEKPNRAVAEEFLKSGEYLWNSGMFIFKTKTVLDNYRTLAAETLNIIEPVFKDNPNSQNIEASIYETIPDEPFDKAIMEKSNRVAVVPCNPQWSDIGSWESLWEISNKDSNDNSTRGRVYMEQSESCIVHSNKLLIGCAGIKDIVIIETGDAILIANKSNGEALKKLVTRLRQDKVPEASFMPRIAS